MHLIFRSFDVILRVKSTDFNQISARPDSRTRESRTARIRFAHRIGRSLSTIGDGVGVWNWNSTFKCSVVSSDNITSNPICVTFVYQSGTKGFVDRWIHGAWIPARLCSFSPFNANPKVTPSTFYITGIPINVNDRFE